MESPRGVNNKEETMKTRTMMTIAAGLAAVLVAAPQTLRAQISAGTGWIEGTVLTKDGRPVWVLAPTVAGYQILATGRNGKLLLAEPKPDMGGFYSMKDLPPGIYEISVPATKNDSGRYRPQQIHGVVVKP